MAKINIFSMPVADSRALVEEKASVLKLAQILLQRQGKVITDSEAVLSVEAWEKWAPNRPYGEGQIIRGAGDDEALYRVMVEIKNSEATKPPGSAGMLAVYRPIAMGADGDLANPIPYIYGMDVASGKYYSYERKVYLAKADMIPCVWPPGTAGLWQWQLI